MVKVSWRRSPPTIVKIITAILAFGFLNQLAVMLYGFFLMPAEVAAEPIVKFIAILAPIVMVLVYGGLTYLIWIGHRIGYYGLVIITVVSIIRSANILMNGPALGFVAYLVCLVLASLLLCKKNVREYFGFK